MRFHRRAALPVLTALLLTATPLAALTQPALAQSAPSPAPTTPAPAAPPFQAQGTSAECTNVSDEAPVRVFVETLAPRAPQRSDEPFQVAGRLVNCGREALTDLRVRLAVGPRLSSRSALATADAEPVVGDRRLTVAAESEQLAPGASTRFDLRLLVGALQFGSRNGVFPLTVQARARVGRESSRGQVGLASTFVPWFPDGPIAPTRIAWLIPLVDQPRRGPGEVMLDDALEGLVDDTGPDLGRLTRALLAGRTGALGACDQPAAPPPETARDPRLPCRGEQVPVTYALDPDLLYSVEAMTRPPNGYTVLERGKPVAKPPSAAAEQWLVNLRAATQSGSAVLALPYGDPDVMALTGPGSRLKDDVEALRRLGQVTTNRLLKAEPLSTVTWLPPGPLGSSVDTVAGGEVHTLLVDPSSLPASSPLQRRTPSARTTLASRFGPVNALVVDEALSRLVEPDPAASSWQGPRLAEQRWIAEAAALAAEAPSVSRTFVVAPRRTANLIPSIAAGAMHNTGRLPFLCAVSLASAAAGTERCPQGEPQSRVDTQGSAQPAPRGTPLLRVPGTQELPREVVERLGQVRADSDQFTEQILVGGTAPAFEATARLLRARGRAASLAWRDQPREGRQMLDLLAADVADLRSKVSLISKPVLLTGSVGTIVLSVQNELAQPVTVGVSIPQNSAARLSSSDTEVQQILPGSAFPISVRVEARTSGRFTVLATLLDAAGQPFGPEVELQVRSTQYGRVALAVTGIAFAVLLFAAGLRITRRALRGAKEPKATALQ